MKKSIFITLVLMLSCMLVISVAAEADFDVKSEWVNVVHVSYDELKDTADVTLIACGTDDEKINTPTLASGTKDVIFWGWASANGSDIKGFSYSINEGATKTDAAFKFATEDAVKQAGPGDYDSRFKVKVPVTEGTQFIKIFVDFEDDSSEPIWAAEVTVGTATTEYVDGSAGGGSAATTEPSATTKPSDGNGSTTTPPKTGDADLIFAVAGCGIVLTALLRKKANV